MKKHNLKSNKKEMDIKWGVWLISFLWLMVLLLGNARLHVFANVTCAADMAAFEGVTVSPDGQAWTTDYRNKNIIQMPKGYVVSTGVESALPKLQTGEHYYNIYVEGEVEISKWVVQWSRAQCIHPFAGQSYHGFETADGICESYYHSGWFAYCAACNEPVAEMNIYASKDTVQGIASMPAQSNYLYLCPYCNGLEQGTSYRHLCKKVSHNYYAIAYDKNAPVDASVHGYMSATKHMYNNAEQHEGQLASKKGYHHTNLRKNSFVCEGYAFVGWNEKPDGSGRSFSDNQAVLNLSEIEGDTVTLYAQWVPVQSSLVIDANGGTYQGNEMFRVTQSRGTTYELQLDKLSSPAGWQVNFETNGGSEIAPIKTKRAFSFWETKAPFNGSLNENLYTFSALDGVTDVVKAIYREEAMVLPDSTKENELLVGWYTDEMLSDENFIGKPGEKATIEESLTLYAKWSGLSLWAEENYEAYGGVGAVNLSWQQKDSEEMFYKVYQSADGNNWKDLTEISEVGEEVFVEEKFDTSTQGKEIIITHSGYYKVSAYGGKGADYDEKYLGGAGGSVEAEYWLQEGDTVQVFSGECGEGLEGGKNGSLSFGGNAISNIGRGGGAATEVYLIRDKERYPLLIAGGGGGASQGFLGGDGGERLSDIGIGQGIDSEYGGSGGGAYGGEVNTTDVRTTLLNPAKEDVAFRSNITNMFPSDTVIYCCFKNNTEYPMQLITGNEWSDATKTVSTGGLNRTLETLRTNYVYNSSGSEQHWGENIIATASEGVAPSWSLRQSQGGFSRTFVADYPTNGNTNLVVSGAIESWSGNVKGDIRFRVLNTETGEILYDVTPASGSSDLKGNVLVLKTLTWGDFDVSGVENVRVEVYMKQVSGSGAATAVTVYDTFFYGKTMSVAGGVTGGTSYINSEFGCKNQNSAAGVNAAAGYGILESTDIGYTDEFCLENVYAKDMAAPNDIVEYHATEKEEGIVEVKIIKPQDFGTDYYHKAESYGLKEKMIERVSTSNVTLNTLTTGVKGYHYYIDENAVGSVQDTHSFWEETTWTIQGENIGQYLHIAPIDKAGNLGKTTSIRICQGEENEEAIPQLKTKMLYLKDTDFVYACDERTYFVKADGKTEHTICGAAYLEEFASQDTQIHRFRLHMQDAEQARWMEVKVPYGDIGEQSECFTDEMLSIALSQPDLWYIGVSSAQATRTEHCRTLYLEQRFCLSENGQTFTAYPQVFAEQNGGVFNSATEEDLVHSIEIIPDGVCPVIIGLEQLKQLEVVDLGEDVSDISLRAYDDGSGLQEFFITIKNKDNQMKSEFYGNEEGEIVLHIDKTVPLFMGELSVSVFALDNVGNANIIGGEGLAFTLDANIYKERAPEEEVFKTGEGAVLEIAVSGYVEQIEVEFPNEWLQEFPELNQTYIYEEPYLRNKEEVRFFIPLSAPSQNYSITVTAYKKGQSLACKPMLVVVEGSVLDELYTRIRNNG